MYAPIIGRYVLDNREEVIAVVKKRGLVSFIILCCNNASKKGIIFAKVNEGFLSCRAGQRDESER